MIFTQELETGATRMGIASVAWATP